MVQRKEVGEKWAGRKGKSWVLEDNLATA